MTDKFTTRFRLMVPCFDDAQPVEYEYMSNNNTGKEDSLSLLPSLYPVLSACSPSPSSHQSSEMNPNLLLQFIFSLLVILPLEEQRVLAADEPRKEECVPKRCGTGPDAPNISYPFWINGQHPSYCGLPAFEVSCKQNLSVLAIVNEDYYIRDIFYENKSLVLALRSALRVDGSCVYPTRNFTLDSPPFQIVWPFSNNFYFFINCSVDMPVVVPGYTLVPCLLADVKQIYIGRELTKDQEDVFRNKGCSSHVVAPFATTPGINLTTLVEILGRGFPFHWTAPDCNMCQDSGGQCGYSNTNDNFMCICSDRTDAVRCDPSQKKRITKKWMITVALSALSGILILVLLLVGFYLNIRSIIRRQHHFWTKKLKDVKTVEVFLEEYGSLGLKRYRFSDVKRITKSFSDKLGQGGYGSVYRGNLSDGRVVAVKLLSESKGNGEDFINEVSSIGRTYHVNIVSLLGFCSDGSKRALIYEFMPNGSLEKFLFAENSKTATPLGWEMLYKIALGIARGLEYLHKGCKTRIVHFDIKPHNILLTEDFCPKISDFGLAKLCPSKNSVVSMTGARGTIGYIAPEVFSRNFGTVSSKSDVYSYGMMVMEMVGGRKNVDARVQHSSEIYFPHWIYEHLHQDGDLRTACGITGEFDDVARKMILVGLWCIQTNPGNRPSMSRVVEILEGNATDLQIPPKPYICSPPRPNLDCSDSISEEEHILNFTL